MTALDLPRRAQLKAFVERIERLEEEKVALADDVKEIYAEAKAAGFDPKTIRRVVKRRKEDANERAEADALFDLYLHALDMRLYEPLASDSLDAALKKAADKPKKAARRKAGRDNVVEAGND